MTGSIRRRGVVALVAMTCAGLLGVVPPAGAQEDGRPTAVVSMGDSYISGEAGRWEGNSSRDSGNRGRTDRAAYRWGWFWRYDQARVYGDSASGCHRSDVAEIDSAGLTVDAAINLACSGADTADIIRAVNGGTSHRGEAPQADQLAAVAAEYDVELIVLSVGGNDLGFADIILDCVLDYTTSPSWLQNRCNPEQQANVDARMAGAMAGLTAAIADIRAVMDESGQPAGSYRFVVQSYPSPIPRGADFRYRESGWSRTFTGGCPFWDADADWANDSLVPQIADGIAGVAAASGVELLDLRDAFDGREVCSSTTSQGPGGDAEWVRYVSTGILQGEVQESMHPNAVGQRALGRCLALVVAAPAGDHRCTNTPGAGPEAMELSSVPVPTG